MPAPVPGTVVSSGSAVGPGGDTGQTGATGSTGSTGPSGPNAVSTDANNLATLGTDNLIAVPASKIWSVRLYSLNVIGNPNFEVDQRTVGAGTSTAGTFAQDRWIRGGPLGFSAAQLAPVVTPPIWTIPGTNFAITSKFLRLTLTTQKATLAATDFMQVSQAIEGPLLRELINDVHSVSILCRSSVATNFCVSIRDNSNSNSLVLLSPQLVANTWTLIPFPNLALWPTAGTFPLAPGGVGYQLSICLAAGSTYQAPAAGSWQSGNFLGAVGQSNFAASPVNSTFDLAFVQHEPGPQCTTLIDKPFVQNLDECQRYFQKTYNYGVAPGAVNGAGCNIFVQQISGAISPTGSYRFKKTMAKVPTVIAYSPNSGNAQRIYDPQAPGERVVNSYQAVGDDGYVGLTLASYNTVTANYQWQHTADTGW